MTPNIAIVVLGCAAPPYDEMIGAMRSTWGSVEVPGVDVTYVYGNPSDERGRSVLAQLLDVDEPPVVADGDVIRLGDILIAGCADSFNDEEDCLLRKRLLAFEQLLTDPDVDFVYTVCAASYVDQPELVKAAAALRAHDLFYGPLSFTEKSGAPFVSGSSMLLSRDLAERLVHDKDEIVEQNQFGWRDDVTFGHWVATRYCGMALAELLDGMWTRRRFEPEQIFYGGARQTADFVRADHDQQQLRPGVYHYHFHSRRPDDLRRLHSMWMARRQSQQ